MLALWEAGALLLRVQGQPGLQRETMSESKANKTHNLKGARPEVAGMLELLDQKVSKGFIGFCFVLF